jgi:hypothetical protein
VGGLQGCRLHGVDTPNCISFRPLFHVFSGRLCRNTKYIFKPQVIMAIVSHQAGFVGRICRVIAFETQGKRAPCLEKQGWDAVQSVQLLKPWYLISAKRTKVTSNLFPLRTWGLTKTIHSSNRLYRSYASRFFRLYKLIQ